MSIQRAVLGQQGDLVTFLQTQIIQRLSQGVEPDSHFSAHVVFPDPIDRLAQINPVPAWFFQ